MNYSQLLYKASATLGLGLLSSVAAWSQVSVTATGGTLTATYPTVAAAVAAINAGTHTGTIAVNVNAGHTETAPTGGIALTATGTAANPITIQKLGAGANPVITAYTGGTGTPGTAVQDGIFRLVGSDYVTIDGIDLAENAANTANPATMEYGYALYKASATDGCQNNTIRNCAITLNRINNAAGTTPMFDGSIGILMINSTAAAATTALTITAATGASSNNRFYTNTIQNCNIGIALSGFAAATPFTLADMSNDIGGTSAATGNIISNFGGGATTSAAAGIRLNNQWSSNVAFNTINNNTGTGVNHAATLRGILTGAATSANLTISNNSITLTGGGTTAQLDGISNGIGSTAASNLVQINSNMVSLSYASATGATINGITNSATAATVTLSSNTVTAPSLGGTGTHLMIAAGSPTNLVANNNVVTNVVRTSATTGTLRGIVFTSPTTVIANGNTIDGMSYSNVASTGSIDGIVGVSFAIDVTINNNIVRNLSTPTTGTINGIRENGGTGNKFIQNNTVSNFSTTAGGAGGGAFNGIFVTASTPIVSGNRVFALSTTGTAASTITGIQTNATTSTVANNRIYDLSTTSTAPTVSGVLVSGGTTVTVQNNMIGDLRATAASAANAVIGLNITGGTTVNAYYNTVYLAATSSGANFGTSAISAATSANLTLNNNIFVNASTSNGTGSTVAYRRSSATLTSYQAASNRNDFFAPVIYTDGTTPQTTLAGFQTAMATRDANSISENPPFLSLVSGNANFLKINTATATGVESGGAVISGINTDFEGDVRYGSAGYTGSGFAPDMGADEFNGVSTVAACSGMPAAANAVSSVTTACASTVISLSLSTTYTGPGFMYQWQASTNGGVSYTNISGATLSIASATQVTATSYRAIVTCANSGQSITATPVSVAQSGRFQCYCAATYSSGPGTTDGITNVTLGTLNNTSTQNNVSPYYTFFNTVTIPNITQSATETASITFGSDGSQFAGVWIDYNQDGDFDDAGEFVSFNTVTAGASGTAAFTFTVPAGALTGQTMMRVRGGNDSQLSNTPCGASSSGFGETEDYIVNVVASTACSGTPAATNAVSSVTSTCPSTVFNLSLSTAYVLTGISYQWQSSTDGGATYTNIAGATTAAITATQTTATFYRAIVTCANSAQSITATPVSVALNSRFQCYCAPTYATGSGGGDSITRVAINTLNNVSGGSPSPYYTFFNTVTIPTITQNATETVSISFGSDPNQFSGVWIDYNQDGDFADAGEFVAFSTVSPGASGTSALTFTVPAGALTGQTMMRVRGGNDSQLGNTPCGASSSIYGETEDYIVSVVTQPACTGTPAATNAVSSVTAACPSTVLNLNLSTTYAASGITYQWQSSTNGGASYTNISGATTAAITATQTTTTFYRAIVTCANSGQTISSAAVSVTQNSNFQCYCASTYTSGPGTTDGITNVTLGTLNNTSTQNNVSPYYTFFGTVTVPNLGQNSNQTISVTFGSDGNQYSGVWIDYNQDGDFADAGEFVAFNTVNAGASGTAVLTFTVPSGATLGQTLMRVRGGNDSQLTNTPCGASSSGFGETEDYIVNIVCVSPTIASTVTAPSCAGGNNGMIATTATGGVTPYMYMWSNGQTTAMATGLMAGSYTLTVAETGGCRTTSTFTVTNPAAVSVTANVTSDYNGAQISCFGAADGAIAATATGGTAPFSYMWSAAQTTAMATGLMAGSYTVTATDANGCSATRGVTVTQPSQITASTTAQTNVSCFGGADGSVTAIAIGGTGAYTYMWANGAMSATNSGLIAGAACVTVTDLNGCRANICATISQPATAVTATATSMPTSCFNTADGMVMAMGNGGTGALSYNIGAGAQASGNFNGLAAGSYTVTVTDANGCMVATTASVASPAAISATTSSTAVSCNGGNNGTATVVGAGGTGTISYNWITGANTSTITNLFATTYAVTVSDANGCSVVTNVAVTQPAALVGSASVSSNYNGAQISCFGAADGAITANAIGGTTPYMFMWADGQTAATATGLAAGSYRLTVTDANGCTNTANTAIGEPSPLDIRISTVDALCNGGQNGIATASVTGGTVSAGYMYMWSNNQTTNTATGLMAGSYTVMVTDMNGCTESATATIAEPAALSLNVTGTNVTACGGADGTAMATVGGGTTPYMYMWSNGATTDALMMLSLGIYSVTVTDDNGCMKDGAITINEPSAVSVSATSTDALCNAAASGTAVAVATGGLAPYVFNWSDGTQVANAPALAAGVYVVTATDAAGCSGVASVTISEPAAISVSVTSTDEQCVGCIDGTATATATGGTGALMFMWSNAQTTATATGLATGSYTVTVTDANGCEATENIVVGLVGVTNTANPEAVKLYPNPTSAVINVENIPANARIQLVNALGQVVRSFEPNQTAIQMDMSALAPATYYVQIISQGRTQVLPVVKVRQ